jgi:hypothetical protein
MKGTLKPCNRRGLLSFGLLEAKSYRKHSLSTLLLRFEGSLKAGRRLQPKLFPASYTFHLKATQHTEQHRCSLCGEVVAGPDSCPCQCWAGYGMNHLA